MSRHVAAAVASSSSRPRDDSDGPASKKIALAKPPIPDEAPAKRRRHTRRGNKGGERHRPKQWKPFNRLTVSEREALTEREARHAEDRRAKSIAEGHPLAPYNTTQFIIEEHDAQSNRRITRGLASQDNTPLRSDDNETNGTFDSEFLDLYETCHSERLLSLSKDELITEMRDLERQQGTTEQEINRLRRENEWLRTRFSVLREELLMPEPDFGVFLQQDITISLDNAKEAL